MEVGDPLFFYRNKTSKCHANGLIEAFCHTTLIRDEYWNGGPAIDVFAVNSYEEMEVEQEVIDTLLGYKENFWTRERWRVADDRPGEAVVRKLDV